MDISDYREHILPMSNKLLRFAGTLLNDREDARDVVQDVLLKLWEKRDDLARVENREAYAMQMIRNKCLDKIRESNKVIAFNGTAERKLNEQTDDGTDITEWKDTGNLVRSLIGKLPEQQKNVIFLRDLQQKEYGEITEITGMNLNAVRVTLSRARKQVRDELLKLWENENRRSENIAAKIF